MALAKSLETDSPYLSGSMRNDCAEWIGRVVGYLDEPADLGRLKTVLQTQDTRISEILNSERLESYRNGKNSSSSMFAALSGLRDRQLQSVQQKRDEQKQQIADQESRIRVEQAKIRESAGKNKEQFEKLLAGYDSQLALLESEYNRLTSQIRLTALTISQLQTQIVDYNNKRERALRNKNTTLANSYQVLISRYGQKLREAQQQYQRLKIQEAAVNQQAAVILPKRQAVVAGYQQETGKLLQQSSSLNQWSKRLQSQQKSLDNPRKTRSGRTAAVKRKLRALNTYVAFDLEAERINLLATLSPLSP